VRHVLGFGCPSTPAVSVVSWLKRRCARQGACGRPGVRAPDRLHAQRPRARAVHWTVVAAGAPDAASTVLVAGQPSTRAAPADVGQLGRTRTASASARSSSGGNDVPQTHHGRSVVIRRHQAAAGRRAPRCRSTTWSARSRPEGGRSGVPTSSAARQGGSPIPAWGAASMQERLRGGACRSSS